MANDSTVFEGLDVHNLSRKGFVCKVCAPSLIAKKAAGDRVKTDRSDAERLVKSLRMDDLSFVHVPDEHDEAFRELVRAWGAAKEDLKKAKQRLKGFLLVHGVRYSGHADCVMRIGAGAPNSRFRKLGRSWRSRNTGARSRTASRSASAWNRPCVKPPRPGASTQPANISMSNRRACWLRRLQRIRKPR